MQRRLRIFAAACVAFAFTQPVTASAAATSDLTQFTGSWTAAAASAASAARITTSAAAAQLTLTLPDSMKIPGAQTLNLDRVDAARFRSADGTKVTVEFLLKAPGQAELTVKYWNNFAWNYWNADLTRQ